jgi:exosortase family protein XrtM
MRPFLIRCAAFLAIFFVLQTLWTRMEGGWLQRLWVDTLTVQTATAVIGVISPQAQAQARGTRIVAAGGGLNILNGCEGTEVLFLLIAALVVAPLTARARLYALASGLVFVFAVNQLRILVLFFAFRHDKSLFDLLHTMVAPLVLVALTGLFFQAWLRWSDRRESSRSTGPAARDGVAA